MEDTGFSIDINWVTVPIFLALAIAIALYARHVSGGWTRPWLSVKPVWWFLLLFFLPWIGLPVLVVSLIVRKRTPGAVTGRKAAG